MVQKGEVYYINLSLNKLCKKFSSSWNHNPSRYLPGLLFISHLKQTPGELSEFARSAQYKAPGERGVADCIPNSLLRLCPSGTGTQSLCGIWIVKRTTSKFQASPDPSSCNHEPCPWVWPWVLDPEKSHCLCAREQPPRAEPVLCTAHLGTSGLLLCPWQNRRVDPGKQFWFPQLFICSSLFLMLVTFKQRSRPVVLNFWCSRVTWRVCF